jgi:acetyltransferase-like isoleucine patch superfamily enzyme
MYLLALRSIVYTFYLRLRGVQCGLVTCEGRLPVLHAEGTVKLGRVSLRALTARVEIGAERSGRLTIGERVFINQGATIVSADQITIGDDCRIGDYATIYDTEHHPLEPGAPARSAPVTIGRNVWIARGALVLPGVTIGDHAVIAASALVTEDVPDRTLVAGVPARKIRRLEVPDGWRRP